MSHTSSEISTSKVIRALGVRWLWFYIVAHMLFAFTVISAYIHYVVAPTELVLYPGTIGKLGAIAFLPSLLFFVIGCVLRGFKRRSFLAGIVVFIPSILFGTLAVLYAGNHVNYLPEHLDEKSLNGHIYNLDVYYLFDWNYGLYDIRQVGHPFATEGLYLLYQCDSLNILCSPVYRKNFTLPFDMHGYKVHLLTTEAGQLSISMGGNIVFSYHLS